MQNKKGTKFNLNSNLNLVKFQLAENPSMFLSLNCEYNTVITDKLHVNLSYAYPMKKTHGNHMWCTCVSHVVTCDPHVTTCESHVIHM